MCNERAFSVVLREESGKERIWTGAIDRLMPARQGNEGAWAEVLDCKTNAVDGGGLDECVESCRPPLEGYTRVVAWQTELAVARARFSEGESEPGL